MLKVYLKKSRDKPVRNGHPWIYSGAIQNVEGPAAPGEPCMILCSDGTVLGHGYYNEASTIRVRMVTKGDVPFSRALLHSRIERAILARTSLRADPFTDCCRLINAEGDFLPGLVVDTFANCLCLQITSAGMERMRTEILSALADLCNPQCIVERSDSDAREREGCPFREGVISGEVPVPHLIRENGVVYRVDLIAGQKTGFYCDQRDNRLLVRSYAAGRNCIDCFSYCGSFALNLLAGNAAQVRAIDSSKQAISQCRENIALNRYEASRMEYVVADAFSYLRSLDRSWDLFVLDPPKFARHPGEMQRAARGYKDINLVAMRIIKPGGMLFTFSCSTAVDVKLFRQIVFAAAVDAGREVQLLHHLAAGPDHPVDLCHPEGDYLKGLALRIL